MEIIEAQEDGLVTIANPQFASLMTSKWLCFGRVLFSPVHFELKDPNKDRLLVIDGLGEDWSYHCAFAYPEATVYNLVPEVALSAMSNTNAPKLQTVRNHHNFGHQSLADYFPFPKGFFAAVILRFPSAMSSSVQRLVISECKRVLEPGGHLEFTVLDINLVNMGNRAQKAVQGLKGKIQSIDKQVSLRNISDEITASLSGSGFINYKRCLIGVPVAGKLSASDAIDTPEDATSPVDKAPAQTAKQPKPEVSFSGLLDEQPFTEPINNGIDEIVAHVGRWWYSRCYESLVLPEGGEINAIPDDLSIWKDESLIEECKMRGTSFRLLIGHAQKPEVGSRHAASV
jgi:SAM-dependent methyltransferase